ncbi:MAG TPA: hypothetical protein VHG93_01635 [Longimicrobium sp.]|nr:hypothetical protein [Longimicrobium sp.]
MSKMILLRNALYSAVMAAALVFGASQAFATPQMATARECSAYAEQRCRTQCQQQGYDDGTCSRYSSIYCDCWFY